MPDNIIFILINVFFSFFDDIKIIHFLGAVKPWAHHYDQTNDAVFFSPGTDASQYGAETFVKKWWQVYCNAFPTELTQSGVSHTCIGWTGIIIVIALSLLSL